MSGFGEADNLGVPEGGGGSGTVTSVGLTVPAGFSVSGSPVTTSGTLAVSISGGDASKVYFGDGSWGYADRVVRLTGDITGPVDATSNTLANITGLLFAVAANEEWEAEARIIYTTNATTTGFFLTATVPSSPTAFVGEVSGSSGATTNQIRHFNAGDGGSAFGNALSGNNVMIGRFILRNGANAGNLQLRYASELASNGVVVKAGSYLKYRRLA